MRNEILQYGQLDNDSVSALIQELNWIGSDQVYAVRMHCPGGDVQATWGVIAKMNELRANGCISIAKVDGMAMSMAGVWLGFFDQREALAVSNIMLHRAAFGYNEDGTPYKPSKEEAQQLAKINNDLKVRLSQVIDNAKLKAIKGYDIESLFDETKPRTNCYLTAEEAQEIGLITKIIPVDTNSSKIMARAITACYDPAERIKVTATTAGISNPNGMTKEEYKIKHPEAFKAIEVDAVNVFKASAEGKGTFAKCASCEPGKEAKAAEMSTMITAAVDAQLKALGLAGVGAIDQTAEAQAKMASKAAEDLAANKKAEAKVLADLQLQIDANKSGKIIS